MALLKIEGKNRAYSSLGTERTMSESPGSVILRTHTRKVLPQAFPRVTLSDSKEKTNEKLRKEAQGSKDPTSHVVVDTTLAEHRVVLDFRLLQRRAVVGDDDEPSLALSQGLEGGLVAENVPDYNHNTHGTIRCRKKHTHKARSYFPLFTTRAKRLLMLSTVFFDFLLATILKTASLSLENER